MILLPPGSTRTYTLFHYPTLFRSDSAVRITHGPTGIIVACQNQRSQHKNKAEAMNMLKARMYEAELQRREAEANATHQAKSDIGWGHQIRSYVLKPYQMVKEDRKSTSMNSRH